MSAPSRVSCAVALAVALAACSQAGAAPTNVAFARPGNLVFACFDLNTHPPTALPLANCIVPSTGTATLGLDLHTLVLQTATGQLALVDVQQGATSALIDSNATVPGYTFLSIGDRPVDIAATDGKVAGQPLTTYIAHAGSRDLWWAPTAALRNVATTPTWTTLDLGAEPSALALSPNEDFLFVALKSAGIIRQYPLDPLTGAPGAPTEILLTADVPTVAPATADAPWEQVCPPVPIPTPTDVVLRTPRAAGASPTPTSMALDTSSSPPSLLVSDSSLPVLHVIPIAGAAGLTSTGMQNVTVGTPTTKVVVTPPVPHTTSSQLLDDRYAYAIDDRGDVLVVDLTDGSPTFHDVLPVSAATSRPPDRISFGTQAESLEVLTPGGFGTGPLMGDVACEIDTATGMKAAVPTSTTIGPTHLRGVFLAVGLADGTVRIVDVWDHDALCRGIDGTTSACTGAAGADTSDTRVFVRRHRPRIGGVTTDGATLTVAPAFGAIAGVVAPAEGTYDLAPFASGCPAPLAGVYPSGAGPGEMTVCSTTDPWGTIAQGFSVTYEGAIVSQALGYFDVDHYVPADPSTRVFRMPGIDACDGGIVGQDEAALASVAGVPSFQNGEGDQLVIVGDPPDDTAMTDACAGYVADATKLRVAFQIRHAYADGHLELGPMITGPSPAPADDFAAAAACFSQITGFEVRTHGSWLVRGGASGVLSRVKADAGGTCVVDASASLAGLESRAYVGSPFQSRELAFQLVGAEGVPGTQLTFTLGGLPTGLAATIGTFPWEIRYSPVDQKMYVVDAVITGLSRVALDGFTIEVSYH